MYSYRRLRSNGVGSASATEYFHPACENVCGEIVSLCSVLFPSHFPACPGKNYVDRDPTSIGGDDDDDDDGRALNINIPVMITSTRADGCGTRHDYSRLRRRLALVPKP